MSGGVGAPAPRRPLAARLAEAVYTDQACTRWFMQHVREVAPTAQVLPGGGAVWALPRALRDLDRAPVRGGDGRSWPLEEMLAATHTDGVLVLHRGEVVYERYFGGMSEDTQHMYQSVSKSVGAAVAARLIEQGTLSAETPVTDLVPELSGSGYDGATVRHLLDMQVGVRFSEEYEDEDADIARLDRLYGFRPRRYDDEPGSSYAFAAQTAREGEHGHTLHYVSLNLQVLGWVMERATGRCVPDLIAGELWSGLGCEHAAYIALDSAGAAQLEGGFCSSLRDLARFGLMLCRGGDGAAGRVLPEAFVADSERNGDPEAYATAGMTGEDCVPDPAYRNNFWTASFDGHHVLMGVGIFGQYLYVDRVAGFVLAKFSTWPHFSDDEFYCHQFAAARSLAELLS
jgi:CubicO group peptidase (beta-lactamase class C family)